MLHGNRAQAHWPLNATAALEIVVARDPVMSQRPPRVTSASNWNIARALAIVRAGVAARASAIRPKMQVSASVCPTCGRVDQPEVSLAN